MWRSSLLIESGWADIATISPFETLSTSLRVCMLVWLHQISAVSAVLSVVGRSRRTEFRTKSPSPIVVSPKPYVLHSFSAGNFRRDTHSERETGIHSEGSDGTEDETLAEKKVLCVQRKAGTKLKRRFFWGYCWTDHGGDTL